MRQPTLRAHLWASVLRWLPLATLTVLLSGMVYGGIQQDYRSSANDPQIQIATDARNALNSGATPASVVPANQIDMSQSLAPYLAIYDASGHLLSSSATLHGQPLSPPSGVFQSAKALSIDKITWMPEQGVRSAVVVMPYNGGYVLAGRSLREIELREDDLLSIVAVACAFTLLATLAVVFVTNLLMPSAVATPAPRR